MRQSYLYNVNPYFCKVSLDIEAGHPGNHFVKIMCRPLIANFTITVSGLAWQRCISSADALELHFLGVRLIRMVLEIYHEHN